jgi:hypothetical protein
VQRLARLRDEVARLGEKLDTANELIEAQGKVSALLGGDVPPERRTEHEQAVEQADRRVVADGSVSTGPAVAFGVHPRTWRHRRQKAAGTVCRNGHHGPNPPARNRTHPAKIDDDTRAEIRSTLCERRFCDLAPAQVYATLLDEERLSGVGVNDVQDSPCRRT